MLHTQPRHRPDKENIVHKTPAPSKSILASKNFLKTPFHDENQQGKKSVLFNDGPITRAGGKFDAFKTPIGPRRILGGKDINTRQTPFQPTTPAIDKSTGFNEWSASEKRQSVRKQLRRSSGISQLNFELKKNAEEQLSDEGAVDVSDIEYMPPTAKDIPFEPDNYSPPDWQDFATLRPNLAGYYLEYDSQGRTTMERDLEEKYIFPYWEELPTGPSTLTRGIDIKSKVSTHNTLKANMRRRPGQDNKSINQGVVKNQIKVPNMSAAISNRDGSVALTKMSSASNASRSITTDYAGKPSANFTHMSVKNSVKSISTGSSKKIISRQALTSQRSISQSKSGMEKKGEDELLAAEMAQIELSDGDDLTFALDL